MDYPFLFSVSLLEYVKASQDVNTGKELYGTALKQFELHMKFISEKFLYAIPEELLGKWGGESWHFVDCA